MEKLQNQLELAELSLPLEYSIPFDTGSLHVTQAAHEAYCMIPLSPNVIEGGQLDRKDTVGPKIDIILIGPNEFDTSGGDMLTKSHVYKDGVGLVVGFSDTHAQMREKIITSIADSAQEADIDLPDGGVGAITSDEGISLDESLANEVPQILAHSLANAVAGEVRQSVEIWAKMNLSRAEYKKIVVSGSLSLIGTGLVLSPQILLDDRLIGPGSLLIGAAYSAFFLNMARRRLKEFIDTMPKRESIARILGMSTSLLVAEGVHASFCSKHFNRTAEEQLGGDN